VTKKVTHKVPYYKNVGVKVPITHEVPMYRDIPVPVMVPEGYSSEEDKVINTKTIHV